jgi:probable HAF family extracellular repeat protein
MQALTVSGYVWTGAPGVSGDGSTSVGSATPTVAGTNSVATLWPASGPPQTLGYLRSDYQQYTFATGASYDGSVLTGYGLAPAGEVPFRWTAGGGMQPLMNSGQPVYGTASGISTDGSVIVGRFAAAGGHGFRWSNGVAQDLGAGPGGYSDPRAVSADGGTVVGAPAFRWTASTGLQSIPLFAGAQSMVTATGVNADGTMVVGLAQMTGGGDDGFIWTPSTGTVLLRDFLTRNGVSLPADLRALNPDAISADGTTIVGAMNTTSQGNQGFVAVVPAPTGTVPMVSLVLVLARRRNRRTWRGGLRN